MAGRPFAATSDRPWEPAPDEALRWFRPHSILPARPRPLDFTLEVFCVVSGLTRALVSLNYPLFYLRPKLIDGELYLASVPSGIAEREPKTKMGLLRDASLRFTRNLRGPWERLLKEEVEGYNAWMAQPLPEAPDDVAERLRRLRRVREMQWFAMDRGVVGSLALLEKRLADTPASTEDHANVTALVEDGQAVLKEALSIVRDDGLTRLDALIGQVAKRLVDTKVLETADDIHYLEWKEVRQALREPGDWRSRAAERRVEYEPTSVSVPEELGPPLAPDAIHMHLVREAIALLVA